MFIKKYQNNINQNFNETLNQKKLATKTDNKNKKQVIKIAAATIGGSALLALGLLYGAKGALKLKQKIEKLVVKTKQKQPIKKTQISQTDIERKIQQQREEAIFARKKAQETKLAAEKQAQEKAANESQLKAEKAAEKAKIAQELAVKQKIHKETICKLDDYTQTHSVKNLNINDDLNNLFGEIVFAKSKEFSKTKSLVTDIAEIIKEAENKGDNISINEVKKILKDLQAKTTIEALNTRLNDADDFTQNTIKKFLFDAKSRDKYIDDILELIDDMPKEESEKTSDYLLKIITKHVELMQKQNNIFDQMIKSKISYATDDVTNDVIKLTKEERQQLAEEFNRLFNTTEYTADTPISKMATIWKHKYISGYQPDIPTKTEQALFQQFKPYQSPVGSTFEKEPVYRWLRISNIDDFLKQFTDDAQYSYNKLQSCSKLKDCGEFNVELYRTFINFADNYSDYNVKFVIHPKGTTNARELGIGKYGANEVIYPAGQKFKVLGKIHKEINPQDYGRDSLLYNTKFEPFHRWEIHLQEL